MVSYSVFLLTYAISFYRSLFQLSKIVAEIVSVYVQKLATYEKRVIDLSFYFWPNVVDLRYEYLRLQGERKNCNNYPLLLDTKFTPIG